MIKRLRSNYWYLSLLFLIPAAVGVRAYGLTSKSFWFDEAYVYWVSVGPIHEAVWRHQAYHVDPPAIGLAINLLSRVSSNPEWIRIIPFVFSALATVAFALFALRRIGPVGAAVGVAFMAFSYNQIAYGQETSEYSLIVLLTTLALWLTPWPGERFDGKRVCGLAGIWFVSPFCAYGMLFPLAAIAITWVIFWSILENRRTQDLLKWVMVQCTAIPSAVIVYDNFLRFQIDSAEKDYLVSGYLSTDGIISSVYFLANGLFSMSKFSYSGSYLFFLVVIIGFLLTAIYPKMRVFTVSFIIMLCILAFFSYKKLYPFYGGRQTMFITVYCYFFAAYAISVCISHRTRSFRASGAVIALILLAAGLRSTALYHGFDGNENIKAIGRALTESRAEDEAVFVHPLAGPAFFVHFPELPGDVYRPNPNPMDTIFEAGARQRWATDFLEFLTGRRRIWLVFSHIDQSGRDSFLSRLPVSHRSRQVAEANGSVLLLVERSPRGEGR